MCRSLLGVTVFSKGLGYDIKFSNNITVICTVSPVITYRYRCVLIPVSNYKKYMPFSSCTLALQSAGFSLSEGK